MEEEERDDDKMDMRWERHTGERREEDKNIKRI